MLEQVGVIDFHHAGARARWRDYVLAALKDFYEARGHPARFILKAAVERGLAAAGLVGGEIDFDPEPAQDGDRARPDLGRELV